MKTIKNIQGFAVVALMVCICTLASFAASLFQPWHCNYVLGTSPYNRVNASSLVDLVALDSKAQEELWVKRVLVGAKQDNIFADNMMGGPGSGKPFITYDDLSKVAGQTIHVPTAAGLGGPGSQGEGDRVGNEEKIRIGSFPVQIGRQWFGVGITDVAIEETVVGSQFDNMVNDMLRTRLALKKSEDMLMTLRAYALPTNTARPNYKATRESLRSADVVSTSIITNAGLLASSLGAKPMKVGTGGQGDKIEKFLFFGSQQVLAPLRTETAYLEAQRQAGERGAGNSLFKGDYSEWDGHGIYRWYLRDHDKFGPVGSTILPRAFLGTAITAVSTPTTITGGGSAEGVAATPVPQYFEAFSNFGYTYSNGLVSGLDTSTERFLAIQNISGADAGKIGFYSFKVNGGGTITAFKRLRASDDHGGSNIAYATVGNVTWDSGAWPAAGSSDGTFAGLTDAHPVGSLIVECNSYGVPLCYALMLGEMAGITGHGSLKGRNALGARTEEHRNHGMDHGIGIETVFGTAVVQRTDGIVPNYVLVEAAYPIPGFPNIT